MKIFVTGGAGYIGSHTCLELLQADHDLVVIDNLSNSNREALNRVVALAGRELTFVEGDIRDFSTLDAIFSEHPADAVIHFAGLKAVGESTQIPVHYYDNNVGGTVALLKAMAKHDVKTLVFSSSATVYGDPATVPIKENFPLSATNPYGRSKLMIEKMLADVAKVETDWSITLLRYFNPVGAHESGSIGEDPNGIPNNLLPYISQVAVGKLEKLRVFGNNYPTRDGTGVRDYIHVVDLAKGHLAAMEAKGNTPGLHRYNLGTGNGQSVLEIHAAFEAACGQKIPYEIVDRRPGDIAECYADPSLAEQELNWRATRTLEDMTRDTWKWQSENPNGYDSTDPS